MTIILIAGGIAFLIGLTLGWMFTRLIIYEIQGRPDLFQ